jgi:hypothetical protein
MGYISVVCTNTDCALETTRTEDTEFCPKCGSYTQPIAGLTSQAAPVAPMVNNNISPEVLKRLAESKPIEFDGNDLKFIYSLLDQKKNEYLHGVVQLEAENQNAKNTKEYFDLCSGFDHAFKIMDLIKADFKRNRAKVEIHRRMTGFYSKPENIKEYKQENNLVSIA